MALFSQSWERSNIINLKGGAHFWNKISLKECQACQAVNRFFASRYMVQVRVNAMYMRDLHTTYVITINYTYIYIYILKVAR